MSAEGLSNFSDRELLVRIDTRLEGVIADKKDHEERIRKLQEKVGVMDEKINRAVTGKQLWTGAASAVAVAVGAVTLITPLVNK